VGTYREEELVVYARTLAELIAVTATSNGVDAWRTWMIKIVGTLASVVNSVHGTFGSMEPEPLNVLDRLYVQGFLEALPLWHVQMQFLSECVVASLTHALFCGCHVGRTPSNLCVDVPVHAIVSAFSSINELSNHQQGDLMTRDEYAAFTMFRPLWINLANRMLGALLDCAGHLMLSFNSTVATTLAQQLALYTAS
jgi:hypothetical protein